MRRIAGMEDIPRDDEFHFKERATRLVATWQAIIQKAESEATGQTNGVAAAAAEDMGVSDTTHDKEEKPAKPAVNGKKAASSHDAEMVNGNVKEDSQMDTTKDTLPKAEAIVEEKKDDDEAMDMSDS